MSLIVVYFLHNTSVRSFYIDVVLTLSINYGNYMKMHLQRFQTRIANSTQNTVKTIINRPDTSVFIYETIYTKCTVSFSQISGV